MSEETYQEHLPSISGDNCTVLLTESRDRISRAESVARAATRLGALIDKHYPGWDLQSDTRIDLAQRPSLVVRAGSRLTLIAQVPAFSLGWRASNLGDGRHDWPASLWPMQITLALAFRMRMFGWNPELRWPNRIVAQDQTLARVCWAVRQDSIMCTADIQLYAEESAAGWTSLEQLPGAGGHPIEPCQTVISFGQAFIDMLEGPWPAGIILRQFRRWWIDSGKEILDGAGKPLGAAQRIGNDGELVLAGAEGGEIVLDPLIEGTHDC